MAEADRRVLECEQCMYLYDVEATSAPLLLEGPGEATLGESFELHMAVRNPLSIPAMLSSAITIDRIGNPATGFRVERLTEDTILAPGSDVRVSYRVLVEETVTPHMFHAKGLTLLNGSLSWSVRKIGLVGPAMVPGRHDSLRILAEHGELAGEDRARAEGARLRIPAGGPSHRRRR